MDYNGKKFINVGKIIKYKGRTLVCTEENSCTNCYFNQLSESCFLTCDYLCSGVIREDRKSVIYKLKDKDISMTKKEFINQGDITKFENVKLKVIAQANCEGCYFQERGNCSYVPYLCSGHTRKDKVSVIFKKVELTFKDKATRLEIPVNGTFKYKGKIVRCKEHNKTLGCSQCIFDHNEICDNLECFNDNRSDHKDVYFESKQIVRSVGSKIELDGHKYKIIEYTSCHDCAFIDRDCDENEYKCNAHERPDGNNIMYVEIPDGKREIGEKFNYCGQTLKIVKYIDCSVCFFHGKGICNEIKCNSSERGKDQPINFLRVYP